MTLHPDLADAQDAGLYTFLTTHDRGPNARATLTAALRQLCEAGGGTWMQPNHGGGDTIRHPTHLFEISALGINATGMGQDQAVLNWRKLAYRHFSIDVDAPNTRLSGEVQL